MFNELKGLVGKPCWFMDGVLEIRKNADAELVRVEKDIIVLKHLLFGKENHIPISAISRVYRKDL